MTPIARTYGVDHRRETLKYLRYASINSKVADVAHSEATFFNSAGVPYTYVQHTFICRVCMYVCLFVYKYVCALVPICAAHTRNVYLTKYRLCGHPSSQIRQVDQSTDEGWQCTLPSNLLYLPTFESVRIVMYKVKCSASFDPSQ